MWGALVEVCPKPYGMVYKGVESTLRGGKVREVVTHIWIFEMGFKGCAGVLQAEELEYRTTSLPRTGDVTLMEQCDVVIYHKKWPF